MSENQNHNPINTNVFLAELTQIILVLRNSISKLLKENPDMEIRAYRTEWHIRGLVYHCQNLIKHYTDIGNSVVSRSNASPDMKPDVLIIYSPSCQYLMYEFYALVNLARISLDNLIKLTAPLFITKSIPKSITDIKTGMTNCPIYERHSNDSLTKYLIDLRNCLVHYKTFATSDNVYILKEGEKTIEETVDSELVSSFLGPMFRAIFRITEQENIVFNIYIPDNIYKTSEDGNKVISEFTYEMKRNIVGYSMRFIRSIMFSTLEAISYYKDRTKRFIYDKHGLEEKVAYIEFIS